METGAETGGRGVARGAEKSEIKRFHNNKQQSLMLY